MCTLPCEAVGSLKSTPGPSLPVPIRFPRALPYPAPGGGIDDVIDGGFTPVVALHVKHRLTAHMAAAVVSLRSQTCLLAAAALTVAPGDGRLRVTHGYLRGSCPRPLTRCGGASLSSV